MKYGYGLISIVLLVFLLTVGSTGAADQSKSRSPAGNQNQQNDSSVSIDEEKTNLQKTVKRSNHADSDNSSNRTDYELKADSDAADDKAPGIYYQYDKLGRLIKIERIAPQ